MGFFKLISSILLIFFLSLTTQISVAATAVVPPNDSTHTPQNNAAGSRLVAPLSVTNVVITRPFAYLLAQGTGTLYVGLTRPFDTYLLLDSRSAINTSPDFTSYSPWLAVPDPNNPARDGALKSWELNFDWSGATKVESPAAAASYSFFSGSSGILATPFTSTCPSNLVMVPKFKITSVNIVYYIMCYTSALVNVDFTNEPNRSNRFPLTLIPAYQYRAGYNNGFPAGADLDVTFCYKSTDPTINYIQTFPHSSYSASEGYVDVAMRRLPAAAKAKIVFNVTPVFERRRNNNGLLENYFTLIASQTTPAKPKVSITFAQPPWVSIQRISSGSYRDNRYNHNEAEKAYNTIRYFQFVVKADYEWQVMCEPRQTP